MIAKPTIAKPTIAKQWYRQLWAQVLAGMVAGILLGVLRPRLGAQLQPLGDAFIKAIRMLIAPIFFSQLSTEWRGCGIWRASGGWRSRPSFTSKS